ncbi:hypothetical protein A9996_09460 [Gelidibacter algens]|uniref:glycosyltransferase family 2 protein n=1 Tax=Gelidibacter algens TaxID=49280 RepID=UPI000804B1E4|nr:glycosyltransferase family A protein [Gelidibacter algens]OBX25524.1 hypothetical protein A9996_09460 [Gelidibacter algens]
MISVIIPNYNKARYISQTLDSVIEQTYDEWEVIVVDDQSTDGSWELILSYANKYRNIIALKPERKLFGSGCRNYGIEHAKGDYVLFLDSDDVLDKKCLQNRIDYFDSYKDADFIVFVTGTFFNLIGDSKSVWRPKDSNFLRDFLEHKLPWNIMSVLWKKKTLLRLDGFDEDYMRLQDVELHTRALLLDDVKFEVLSNLQPDCFYRIDESRKNNDIITTINNQVQGVTTYINKISEILKNRSQFKYLKSTLFSIITYLNYCYVSKQINPKDHGDFIRDLVELNRQRLNLNLFELKFFRDLYSSI